MQFTLIYKYYNSGQMHRQWVVDKSGSRLWQILVLSMVKLAPSCVEQAKKQNQGNFNLFFEI